MSDTFFKISQIIDRPYNTGKFPGEVFKAATFLSEDATYYEREVYNVVDLIGEIGGVAEFFLILFGLVIYPFSKQSFNIENSEKLFLAKS
jgi:hypothetical protein